MIRYTRTNISGLYGGYVAVFRTRHSVVSHRGNYVVQELAASIFRVESIVYPECGNIRFPQTSGTSLPTL